MRIQGLVVSKQLPVMFLGKNSIKVRDILPKGQLEMEVIMGTRGVQTSNTVRWRHRKGFGEPMAMAALALKVNMTSSLSLEIPE